MARTAADLSNEELLAIVRGASGGGAPATGAKPRTAADLSNEELLAIVMGGENAKLSRNLPVQFGRGVQNSIESIPRGVDLERMVSRTSPMINLMRLVPQVRQAGQAYVQDVQNAPAAKGLLPSAARFSGDVAGYSAAAAPFIAAAESLPAVAVGGAVASRFPGLMKLAQTINSPLGRTALGIGGFEGSKKVIEGKPMEAPGEFAKGAAMTFAGGKVAEVGGRAIQAGLRKTGQVPGAVVNSLIKPLLKDFSYGKNPGRTIAAEGVVGNSFEELAANIAQKREEIGQQIGQVLQSPKNASKKLDLTGALKPITDAIAEAKKYPKTNAALVSRLENTLDDVTARLSGPQGARLANINQVLGSFSPLDATALKTELGAITKWTGNASDDQLVNKALKQAYGFIKEKIGQAVPEVRALNEKFADLLSAEIATKYRDKITSRQNILALAPRLLGGGAAIAGLASGNPQLIAAGIVEVGAEKILSSPALKTRVAAALAKMPADDLARILEQSPALKKIPGLVARAAGASKQMLERK